MIAQPACGRTPTQSAWTWKPRISTRNWHVAGAGIGRHSGRALPPSDRSAGRRERRGHRTCRRGRIVARPGFEKELARRTLTNLYNARPAWLAQAHAALDAVVAAAYGWADCTPELPDDEIPRRLLALNLERSAAG